MARYSIAMSRTASLTLSLGLWNCTATVRRTKLYEVTLGSDNTPADATLKFVFQRFTAAGTSTAVTPQPLDPADAAALTAGGSNATVEPTYTANQIVLTIPQNQRSTFRWVAPTYGEIVTPATNANGIGIQTPVATTLVTITADVKIEEQ
jgi:hypothetical protein